MHKQPLRTIIILGVGFGGLRAATKIAKKLQRLDLLDRYEVVLIDRNDYHTYTPTLYEIATTSKETADAIKLKSIVAFPVSALIAGLPIRFIKAEVELLDLKEGDVHLSNGQKLVFDCLVFALGSETNFFDIPGLKEHALDLKTFAGALKIRDALTKRPAGPHTKTFGVGAGGAPASPSSQGGPLRVVIGGGGSTGVELGAEILEWACETKEKKACLTTVTIIEVGPSILGGFDPRVVRAVETRLEKLGVAIETGETIESVATKEIQLKSGRRIPYDVLVWAGGVRASRTLSAMPLKREKRGRIEVGETLECLPETPDLKLHGEIYGLGDAICFYDPATKRPMPGVARAAIIQADIVAHNAIEDIKATEGISRKIRHKVYRPMNYPYIIPVGGKYAVAKFGPVIIKGFMGWVLKGLVEFYYLKSIMPLGKTLRTWFAGLKIFIQNDRLG
ncbi:MAG: FAD-dependent oxidoreductase [bacterium]|nr:FAD-dependent oxidoreductase [bacterium]